MTHSDAVNAVLLLMSEMGAVPLKYTTGSFRAMDSGRVVEIGREGAADTIHCYRGRYVAIEVKVDRDLQRPKQAAFQRAVEAAGGVYLIAHFTSAADGCSSISEALCSLS